MSCVVQIILTHTHTQKRAKFVYYFILVCKRVLIPRFKLLRKFALLSPLHSIKI